MAVEGTFQKLDWSLGEFNIADSRKTSCLQMRNREIDAFKSYSGDQVGMMQCLAEGHYCHDPKLNGGKKIDNRNMKR